MLTKYQMALIVLANAAALLAAGAHRQPRFARHAALAAAATALPLVPHAAWLVQHQFSTFQYAGHSLLAGLGPLQRLGAAIGFLAQQVARLAPALLALGLTLAIGTTRRGTPGAVPQPEPEAAAPRGSAMRALAVLALAPVAGIVLLVLAAGVAPQNHWGSTAILLIPLLLVARVRAHLPRSLAAAVAATAACHVGAIAWNVTAWRIDPGPHHRFAARALAALAQQHWSEHQRGPIRLVVGPDWEAGSIALYLPGHPPVLPDADWGQAPWVDPGLVSRCGALLVARTDEPLEPLLSALPPARGTDPIVLEAEDRLGRRSAVQAALIAPTPGLECP
jgi:hypothetical protein